MLFIHILLYYYNEVYNLGNNGISHLTIEKSTTYCIGILPNRHRIALLIVNSYQMWEELMNNNTASTLNDQTETDKHVNNSDLNLIKICPACYFYKQDKIHPPTSYLLGYINKYLIVLFFLCEFCH